MEPKRRLAYATEIADFLLNADCGEKFLSQGQNRRVGWVSGNIFFFWPEDFRTGGI